MQAEREKNGRNPGFFGKKMETWCKNAGLNRVFDSFPWF
jgi:hypothetical protein